MTVLALSVVIGSIGATAVTSWARVPADEAARAALARRIAGTGMWGALALLPAAALRLMAQVVTMMDPAEPSPDWPAMTRAVTLHTHWGRAWIAHVTLAALVALVWSIARRDTHRDAHRDANRGARHAVVWPAAVGAVALAATLSLAGHAADASPWRIALEGADLIHVVASSLWLGTLAVLVLVGLTGPTWSGADVIRVLRGFSPLALVSAASVAATGLVAAWAHVGAWSALWGSEYGRTLLVKLALVGTCLVLGAINWRWVTPRLVDGGTDPEAARRAFRRAARLEVATGALVLLATAVLVASPLPGME
jgi:copper transport protein